MKHGELGWTQGAGVRGTEMLYEVTSMIEERGQTDLTLLLLKVLGVTRCLSPAGSHRRTSSWTHTGSVVLSTGLAKARSPCSPHNLDRGQLHSPVASWGSCEQN